jgi:hypothetical protein
MRPRFGFVILVCSLVCSLAFLCIWSVTVLRAECKGWDCKELSCEKSTDTCIQYSRTSAKGSDYWSSDGGGQLASRPNPPQYQVRNCDTCTKDCSGAALSRATSCAFTGTAGNFHNFYDVKYCGSGG